MCRCLVQRYRQWSKWTLNATIGMALELKGGNLQIMNNSTKSFALRLSRLEHWFDRHFGWFFTNGMKQKEQADRVSTKA